MVLRIFLLDDEIYGYRSPILELIKGHELTLATSLQEAIESYEGGYDYLLLDHDLRGLYGDKDWPDNGFHFVEWLVHQKERHKPQVILHSHYTEGRAKMQALLEKHGYKVIQSMPFYDSYLKWIKELFG